MSPQELEEALREAYALGEKSNWAVLENHIQKTLAKHAVAQEPVAFVPCLEEFGPQWQYTAKSIDPTEWSSRYTIKPLYTSPPKREWVGLTEGERFDLLGGQSELAISFMPALERLEEKLKEKNS